MSVTICDGVTMISGVGAVSKYRHYRHTPSRIKFRRDCKGVLFKGQPLPLGERKTCLQVAFLIGSPVKSAFALLLTRVTEPAADAAKEKEVIF